MELFPMLFERARLPVDIGGDITLRIMNKQ